MFADLMVIFNWWFLLLGLGFIFLPTAVKIFGQFADLGYIFAKILGLAIISYLVWLLGSLHLLPFSNLTIWLVIFFSALGNFFLAKKLAGGILKQLRSHWKIIVFEEGLFFVAFLFWAYVRAHEPSIHGLEKFMDFGFINSILRTDFFPPKDLWLTPETINYYYFGHLVTAVLTKLSGIVPEITFNLMLATLFGLTFTGSFSLGLNLFTSFKRIERRVTRGGEPQAGLALNARPEGAPGLLAEWATRGAAERSHAAIALSDGAQDPPPATSLSTIICGLLSAFLVTLGGNLHAVYAFTRGFDKYWYPDATRFIPYTIHEFPSYSWVVSDLHGHVLGIPFVLLTIALLLSLIFNFQFSIFNQFKNFQIKNSLKIVNYKLIILLISFLLAIMYMTNAWDGIIYLVLASLVFFWLSFRQFGLSGNLIKGVALQYLILYLLFFLFALPFTLNFKPFVSGIGLVRDHSPFYMLAILWGFFYFFVASFLLFLYPKIKFAIRSLQFAIFSTDIFVLLLILLSTLLLLFPEIFYVKDIYPLHYRANTMFKLGYQTFIMLSISSAYIVIRLFSALKPHKLLFIVYYLLFIILFVPVAIYPYFAIKSYYGGLKNYQDLNGMLWLQKQYPSDYEAILWLKEKIKGQPVILEAVGESYTDFARVSSFTGLPTVIGWPVHEWLWRGSYDEPGVRDAEVGQVYDTQSFERTRDFLRKYNIKYVFVGTLERQKYPQANFEKWGKLGKLVFRSGYTQVYEISL